MGGEGLADPATAKNTRFVFRWGAGRDGILGPCLRGRQPRCRRRSFSSGANVRKGRWARAASSSIRRREAIASVARRLPKTWIARPVSRTTSTAATGSGGHRRIAPLFSSGSPRGSATRPTTSRGWRAATRGNRSRRRAGRSCSAPIASSTTPAPRPSSAARRSRFRRGARASPSASRSGSAP